jgi:hypothetical protein
MQILVIRFNSLEIDTPQKKNSLEIEFGPNSFWFLMWSRTRIALGATTSTDESVFSTITNGIGG